jgi:O-antigen/teichoic acid export membrane protein
MSGVRGIAKNLSALFSGHAVTAFQNLVQVPFFIHYYGKAGYGEWLALSATVTYLGTLDFGVQTYVNQDLTLRYANGDMDGFHLQQSTALRLLAGIVTVVAALGLLVFILPLQHWLRMDGSRSNTPFVAANDIHWAIYLLGLQILINIIAGYFFGSFMVVGKAYIGGYWNNLKNLLMIVSTVVLACFHVPFAQLALAQLLSVAVILLAAMVHLRAIAPGIFPSLRYWDGSSARRILAQSGYFALIYSSNFLVYQMPLLIMQLTTGPVVITLFSIMRTIFSMTRMQMNSITQAMGPEITVLYGRKDWKMLSRLYNYSERLIFSLIPIANLGALYLSPFLLAIWMRDRTMFLPYPYLLCAGISIVMSIKEHKFQFQFSTNTHSDLGRFMSISYIVLGAIWFYAIPHYGINGLLWAWLTVELCQLSYIVWLNIQFFKIYERLDLKYLARLIVFSSALLALSAFVLPQTFKQTLPIQIAAAIAVGCLILLLDFPLFGLAPVLRDANTRFKQWRAARSARLQAS